MIETKYIKIKDKEIPVEIKSYKTSKTVKMYFRGNKLIITKPKRYSIRNILELLKQEENNINDKYEKILSSEIETSKQWKNNEKIFYKGEEYLIRREFNNQTRIFINIDEKEKQFVISIPNNELSQESIKFTIDKGIKKLFKANTEYLISQKLPFYQKITGFEINDVKVRDAISKFGSCIPSKKSLQFSSRLIMLPEYLVDCVIVHELCHLKVSHHNKEFYDLCSYYMDDYLLRDKELKKWGNKLMF